MARYGEASGALRRIGLDWVCVHGRDEYGLRDTVHQAFRWDTGAPA